MELKGFNTLIETICNEYNISEKDISESLGYNSGYISQVRNREIYPDKFISKLHYRYPLPTAPSKVSEPEAVYTVNHHDTLMDIISRQTRTIESQQQTIHELVLVKKSSSGFASGMAK